MLADVPRGRQPMLPLVDRLLDGKLEELLTEMRADEQSYDTIARRLHAEHDIDVTGETVRRWCIDLDVEAVAS